MTIGVLLPFSPLAHALGFTALPAGFLAALAVMILVYLLLLELGKRPVLPVARPAARATPGPAGGRYGAPLPTPPDPSPGVPLEHRPPTADLSRLTQVGEMSPASSSSHRNRATTGASSSALVIRPRCPSS